MESEWVRNLFPLALEKSAGRPQATTLMVGPLALWEAVKKESKNPFHFFKEEDLGVGGDFG